jgi:UDP-N-acetylmuramoylalanine--D-glutamate ligase
MTGAFAGERAVVLGFGVSGRAAVRALLEEGASVRVSEARPATELAPWDGPEVEVESGGHRPEHLDGASLVVASPGIPPSAEVIGWAERRGLPIVSELELGARLCSVPYLAVTGTNGKTTTTELLAAMLRAGGLAAKACGNVGYPFSAAAREPDLDALVVECSSFQLALQTSLHPRVSVLLNLAPDHLDWHGSFEAYAAAKARVYARQTEVDGHVGNRDDPRAAAVSERAPCRVRWFGAGEPDGPGDTGVIFGLVTLGRHRRDVRGLGRSPLAPPSVALDGAAAAAAAIDFGIRRGAVGEAIDRFVPLPHRGTVVAEASGVRYVDDSKATNPHAALAALEGARDTVLIAGGLAKGVDLSPLAAAAPGLTAVVAIGEAAPELVRVFRGLVPVEVAGSIEDAVRMAATLAVPGGTVLLAPAAASQDMFRDYRERGERFAAAARSVAEGAADHDPSRRMHA